MVQNDISVLLQVIITLPSSEKAAQRPIGFDEAYILCKQSFLMGH